MHHHDAVGEEFHYTEVVGDEEIGVVVAPLEVVEEVEDLGLHADVEGRDALVAHHQLGLEDEGAGDADTLALAAAELVGIAAVPVGLEAYLLHEGEDSFFQGILSNRSILSIQSLPVNFEGFGDGVADGDTWVEAGVGVLEDNLQFGPQGAHLVGGEGVEALSAVEDVAGGVVDESQEGAAEGALATSAFAHQAEGLALHDVEADAVDTLQRLQGLAKEAFLEGVFYRQVLDRDKS